MILYFVRLLYIFISYMEVRTILHTMLFNIVDAILQVYGFDTYYGVFHKCFYMRKSLVCDLMEPIRPVVDYQVRKSINLGQCKENDFEVINNRWCLKYKSNPHTTGWSASYFASIKSAQKPVSPSFFT